MGSGSLGDLGRRGHWDFGTGVGGDIAFPWRHWDMSAGTLGLKSARTLGLGSAWTLGHVHDPPADPWHWICRSNGSAGDLGRRGRCCPVGLWDCSQWGRALTRAFMIHPR
eukprot:11478974-Alexandrium_andersonii.AAC.1